MSNDVKTIIDESTLQPVLDKTMDFLEINGRTALIGFDPAGKLATSAWYWDGTNKEQTRKWLEANWRRRNLHFHVNDLNEGPKKSKKDDYVVAARAHADFDARRGETPEVALARILPALEALEYPPSFTICSGHGVNAVWLLSKSLPKDEIEEINCGLAASLGDTVGDACWNIDRVLRLPSTVNWPNRTKVEKGFHPALSYLVSADPSRVYDPAVLPRKGIPRSDEEGQEVKSAPILFTEKHLTFEQIQSDPRLATVSDRCKLMIRDGDDTVDPDHFKGDRSKAMFAVVCELVRAKIDRELIAAILTSKDLGVSRHIYDQKNIPRCVTKQIQDAERMQTAFALGGKDGKGPPTAVQSNFEIALAKLGVKLSYSLFTELEMISGLEGYGPVLDDVAVTALRFLIEERFGMHVKKDPFWDMCVNVAHKPENRYHDVKDYLEGLEWDGIPRCCRLIPDYFAGPDTEFSRDASLRILLACVARIYEPGYKFDQIPIMEGKQGDNKSSGLKELCPNPDWFAGRCPLGAAPRELMEATSGKWICEDAELTGYNGARDPKSVLSQQSDRARGAYKRVASERGRQFVVFGTTNEKEYLEDQTGNRRIWPFECGRIDLDKLRRDRDQIWAEAVARYKAGERPEMPENIWEESGQAVERRKVNDQWEVMLGDKIGLKQGYVTMQGIYTFLGVPTERRDLKLSRRVGNIMRRMEFERRNRRFGNEVFSVWQRGEGEEIELISSETGAF